MSIEFVNITSALPPKAIECEWKSVPSLDHLYEASCCGAIRRASTKAVTKQSFDRFYWKVAISTPRLGQINRYVHRLVAEAFHGPQPSPDHEVSHENGNGRDSRASNLRWATRLENVSMCKVHGTVPHGERNGQALLSERSVIAMRQLRMYGGQTQYVLAKAFRVSRACVESATRGLTWKHLKEFVCP